ncbi:hypothetical protein [Pleionea sp. CnH1-48]|uniref:hypothetical protein n=1 Tax=Pleionea sp. CnH1-48 TaxID=2954494 RepID=UPI003530FE7D
MNICELADTQNNLQGHSSFSIEELSKFIKHGLYFVVHVNIANPEFASPTKDRLINVEVYQAVANATYRETTKFLKQYPSFINNFLKNESLTGG